MGASGRSVGAVVTGAPPRPIRGHRPAPLVARAPPGRVGRTGTARPVASDRTMILANARRVSAERFSAAIVSLPRGRCTKQARLPRSAVLFQPRGSVRATRAVTGSTGEVGSGPFVPDAGPPGVHYSSIGQLLRAWSLRGEGRIPTLMDVALVPFRATDRISRPRIGRCRGRGHGLVRSFRDAITESSPRDCDAAAVSSVSASTAPKQRNVHSSAGGRASAKTTGTPGCRTWTRVSRSVPPPAQSVLRPAQSVPLPCGSVPPPAGQSRDRPGRSRRRPVIPAARRAGRSRHRPVSAVARCARRRGRLSRAGRRGCRPRRGPRRCPGRGTPVRRPRWRRH